MIKSQTGSYAASWSELRHFVNEQEIYNVEKREIAYLDSIKNKEKIRYEFDTLSITSAYDSLIRSSIYSLEELDLLPDSEERYFSIEIDSIEQFGRFYEVIKVCTPIKIGKKHLAFGSLDKVSLTGNWN